MFTVGIAGGSASGKSTFAAVLAQALEQEDAPLSAEILPMDRYFYRGAPGGPRMISPSSGKEIPDNNHPDSADNARIIADICARRQSENAADVLIVEGLMALHVQALRDCLDLRVFIELDADERALRRLLRDVSGQRGSSDPVAIARYYCECARVGHAKYVEPSRAHADLILRGDGDFERSASMVAAIVRERLRKSASLRP